jgi:hypothetical protein
MSRLAAICLAEGRLRTDDRAWVRLRLRQGRFSPACLAWMDYLCSPRASSSLPRSLHVRLLRAKRLGYRGGGSDVTKWNINQLDLIEKWFADEGLNPF